MDGTRIHDALHELAGEAPEAPALSGPDPTAHHPTPPAADRCDGTRGRRGAGDRRGCRHVGDDER